MAIYEYGIGVNFNATLTRIEDKVISGDKLPRMFAPVGYSNYSPGLFRIKMDKRLHLEGDPTAFWLMQGFTWWQNDDWQDTYCNGGWDGEVTVRTRINRIAYRTFNAIMTLPIPATLQRNYIVFPNYRIDFTLIEMLPEEEE